MRSYSQWCYTMPGNHVPARKNRLAMCLYLKRSTGLEAVFFCHSERFIFVHKLMSPQTPSLNVCVCRRLFCASQKKRSHIYSVYPIQKSFRESPFHQYFNEVYIKRGLRYLYYRFQHFRYTTFGYRIAPLFLDIKFIKY